jgi:N-ethylmaleimide reductase
MQLFSPYQLGAIALKNRVVMAPMTRNRAIGNLANDLMAEYYGQRASAGLIITEGTSPSPHGLGYARIPGLHSLEQSAAWKQVTRAVHMRGGKIFAQLMHTGRVGSPLNLPTGAELLAPSPHAVLGRIWTDSQGEQPYGTPRAMTAAEIQRTINEYAEAAKNAIAAGFDGVEIHGANGYLVNQFLDPGANQRHDLYGDDSTNRNRFALEVAVAVTTAIGAARVGIRVSPYGVFNDMSGDYAGIVGQYTALATGLGGLNLAYLHLVDHSSMGAPKPNATTVQAICQAFRAAGGAAVILSGGYDHERAETDLSRGAADLIAFGRPFIANPDLVARLQHDWPLAVPDSTTFYSAGAVGYSDYSAYPSP